MLSDIVRVINLAAGKRKIWNVQGASNLEELRDRTSKQMLRRLKDDVLDLIEKNHIPNLP